MYDVSLEHHLGSSNPCNSPLVRHVFGLLLKMFLTSGWKAKLLTENLPTVSENLPTVSENLPTVSENLLSVSEYLLTVSENLQTVSENLLTVSEYLLAVSENLPTHMWQTATCTCMPHIKHAPATS